jgi:predicted Zn-dependent peptidase
MATVVLANGKGSRLYANLVRGRLLAQDVGLGAYEWAGGASLAMGWATARSEDELDALEAAYHEEVEGLASGLPTDEEMVRARATVEREELEALQRMSERADRLSMYATLFDAPGMLNARLPSLLDVTPEEITAAVRAVLVPDNRVVLAYVPERAGGPKAEVPA